ncbi:hypothetical protein L917_17669 [Phytophthora nicotianae]|uniref:Nep1-like protein n=1 Tax=Phytophthora nicotianae TaxID=4792 RepID=W2KAI0_PHYNI|nr:hypothetical protein L917_17669 [Phytophthora nicotianae]
MNLCVFIFAITILFSTPSAQGISSVGHDRVKPFPQPEPITTSQKAAVKFKPQLSIAFGCHPYPAVQADGAVSGGLKYSGKPDGDCKGSALGSQVYSRSTWYRDVWAITYAWYLPKGYERVSGLSMVEGHRHFWGYVTVWINNPAVENAYILGVSMSGQLGHDTQAPVDKKCVDGSTLKLEFDGHVMDGAKGKQGLRCVEAVGKFQHLITWDQLTEAARDSLNTYNFDSIGRDMGTVPLKDGVFTNLLNSTWPFSP